MKIYRMPLGSFLANCYIVETENKNAAVIDPGGDYPKLKKKLDELGLTMVLHQKHPLTIMQKFLYMKMMHLCLQTGI